MHHPGEALNTGGFFFFSFLGDFGVTCSGAVGKKNPKDEPGGLGGGSLELWREPFEFVLKVTNHAGHEVFQSWIM